ncbi:hypothetical protein GOODEAATRI_029522 [Goodea atripinnis]|uniref:SAM domain-containing protein n=1 Tax=Goodea atripinnis TaxID=208336 RepID=A0ABV0MW72_9TELE
MAEIQGLQVRIAALESELMQLMKQNGIQVNNNSNSSERLSAQQHIPSRAAAQSREVKEGSPRSSSIKIDCAGDSISFPEGQISQAHGSPAHSCSGLVRSDWAPGSAEGSPRKTPHGSQAVARSSPSHGLEEHRKALEPAKMSGRSHTPVLSSDEILDEVQSLKQHQWQHRSITEWTSQQVARWLTGLNLDQHIPEFTAKNIDGEQLLQLDSDKLKILSVISSQDHSLIKKKIKDLKVLMEKARHNQEKVEKKREKLWKRELEQQQKKDACKESSTE